MNKFFNPRHVHRPPGWRVLRPNETIRLGDAWSPVRDVTNKDKWYTKTSQVQPGQGSFWHLVEPSPTGGYGYKDAGHTVTEQTQILDGGTIYVYIRRKEVK